MTGYEALLRAAKKRRVPEVNLSPTHFPTPLQTRDLLPLPPRRRRRHAWPRQANDPHFPRWT